MEEISIYTVYHDATHIVSNVYIKPIQVGNKEDIDNIKFRDNSGENISEKNSSFCELTAQYWAWKNDKESDYIGIFHYRRFFNFNNELNEKINEYGVIDQPFFSLDFEEKFSLDPENISRAIKGYDVILPVPWDVTNIGFKNIKEHYIKSKHHHERDLIVLRDVISEKFPDYIESFDEVMQSTYGYWTNMFIFKSELFNRYSEWLFDILFEVERRIDIQFYNIQEKRVFGYLSERLLNVWMNNFIKNNDSAKILFLDRVFVKNVEQKSLLSLLPKTNKEIISVVIAADNNYVPHLGALLVSISDNLDKNVYLDLIILNGGISKFNQKLIYMQISKFLENYSLSFIDLYDEFADLSVHMHFSKATFYRLILTKILPEHDKVLYIDCDTIVLDDIAKLYRTNLNNNLLGAVHDYIMEHFCAASVLSIDKCGSLPSKEYLENYVGLSDEWKNYFQAGVIIFDLEKIRKEKYFDMMIKSILDKPYWFLDQDILNKFFARRVQVIDPSWNVVNVGDEVFIGLSEKSKQELSASLKNPKILHYAGYEAKPWNNYGASMNEFYFYYLRKTFWYEKIVRLNNNEGSLSFQNDEFTHRSWLWRSARSIWVILPLALRRPLNGVKEYLKEVL